MLVHAEDRERRYGRAGAPENIDARSERNGTGEVYRESPQAGRRVSAHISIGKALHKEQILRGGVVVNAPGRAQNRLPVTQWVEGKASSRRKVVPVTLVK